MKKIQALILLNCLLLTIPGYHFFYQYGIKKAKEEMHEMIRGASLSSEIITLDLSPSELSSIEWENDHEFRFEESMYDLVDRKDNNGRILLTCIQDEKESRLSNAYRKAGHKDSNENSPLQEWLRLANTPFLQPSVIVPDYFQKEVITYQLLPDASLQWTISAVITPPPEFIA